MVVEEGRCEASESARIRQDARGLGVTHANLVQIRSDRVLMRLGPNSPHCWSATRTAYRLGPPNTGLRPRQRTGSNHPMRPGQRTDSDHPTRAPHSSIFIMSHNEYYVNSCVWADYSLNSASLATDSERSAAAKDHRDPASSFPCVRLPPFRRFGVYPPNSLQVLLRGIPGALCPKFDGVQFLVATLRRIG